MRVFIPKLKRKIFESSVTSCFSHIARKKWATSRSDAAHGKVGLGLPVYLLTAANCRSVFLLVSAAAAVLFAGGISITTFSILPLNRFAFPSL